VEQKNIVLVQEGAHWAQIQALAANAVVQIFSQVGRFNWIEPYNVVVQYEERGSGFFINDQGYIITNAHVVDEAKYVWIQIPALGRQPIEAEIVGVCPERDLALLRLKDAELQRVRAQLGAIPSLILGDSDAARRTDGVLSLGYPLGLYRLKSSTGVVSGFETIKGRALIQTTAPINPGSSGGPLLDARGQVLGIVVSSAELASNIGYAIPVNELQMIIDDLYTNSLVRKPVLGVRFAYASDEQARYFGNPLPSGLYVGKVFKNLLFDRAGVRSGDMLYEFNGMRIDAYGDATVEWRPDKTPLFDLIGRVKVGSTIPVVVYRSGERIELTVSFDVDTFNPIRPIYPDLEPVDYEVIGGLVIMSLADNHLPLLARRYPEILNYAQFENKSQPRLVITHVMPGSYAHQLRTLSPGNIITHTNRKKVSTLAAFRRALKKSIETRFLTLETEKEVFTVFDIERLLADEERLSRTLSYPMSRVVQQLKRAMRQAG